MSEIDPSVLQSEIDEIILAVNDVPLAEKRAKKLELQAASERSGAILRRKQAFAAASERLIWLIKTGSITHSEVIREVAELNDIDPLRHGNESTAEAKIAAFDALQPDTPFIGMHDQETRKSLTGMVMDVPTSIKVHPYKPEKEGSVVWETRMTPRAVITLPVRVLDDGQEINAEVKTELYSLPRVLIGRQAIKDLAESAKFEKSYGQPTCHDSGEYTNVYSLSDLQRNIGILNQLGMEEVDMSAVEKGLQAADSYYAVRRQLNHQRNQMRRNNNRRRRAR